MKEQATITIRQKFGYDLIDLDGDLSINPDEWSDKIISECKDNDVDAAILNMDRITFLNSTALAYIVKVLQTLAAGGIRLFIMNENENIHSLLRTTGVKRYFTFIQDEKEFSEKNKKEALSDFLEEPLDIE